MDLQRLDPAAPRASVLEIFCRARFQIGGFHSSRGEAGRVQWMLALSIPGSGCAKDWRDERDQRGTRRPAGAAASEIGVRAKDCRGERRACLEMWNAFMPPVNDRIWKKVLQNDTKRCARTISRNGHSSGENSKTRPVFAKGPRLTKGHSSMISRELHGALRKNTGETGDFGLSPVRGGRVRRGVARREGFRSLPGGWMRIGFRRLRGATGRTGKSGPKVGIRTKNRHNVFGMGEASVNSVS
jgi:hypothetical protein